jgi:hypothetical protein
VSLERACELDVESIQLCVRLMHASYLHMANHPNGIITGPGVPPLRAILEKYAAPKYMGVANIQPRLL